MIKKDILKKIKLSRRTIIIAAAIALCVGGGICYANNSKAKSAAAAKALINTSMVSRQNIQSRLSSTGTIAPKDTYTITSLVSGNIVDCSFEEGDNVEKDQVLYKIDTSSVESELQSAQNSVERSQTNYDVAKKDYAKALNDYSGNTYKATDSGFIKELKIDVGDKVSGSTELAAIYDDRNMKLRIPFLNVEAAQIPVGSQAVVTLNDTQEQLAGTVTAVSNMDETLTGGRIVRYVTIQVANPGGLTTDMSATATIGEFDGSLEGKFEPAVDKTMRADISSPVKVVQMLVNKGDYVSAGTPLFVMDSDDADALRRSYESSMDQAESSLENSKSNLAEKNEKYDNYMITAPISGTVITKNSKVGDKISTNGNNNATMATIYDLSSLNFKMSIDELDVLKVKVGQKVTITADALPGEEMSGVVTNVSKESTTTNGVTKYPVTVTIEGDTKLIPGMNVTGVITLEEADDALAIPVDSLIRGNIVYVKDASVKESTDDDGAPAGFRAVTVETGIANDDYIEIKSGLSENDEVYVADTTVSSDKNFGIMMGAGGPPPDGGNGGGRRGGKSNN